LSARPCTAQACRKQWPRRAKPLNWPSHDFEIRERCRTEPYTSECCPFGCACGRGELRHGREVTLERPACSPGRAEWRGRVPHAHVVTGKCVPPPRREATAPSASARPCGHGGCLSRSAVGGVAVGRGWEGEGVAGRCPCAGGLSNDCDEPCLKMGRRRFRTSPGKN